MYFGLSSYFLSMFLCWFFVGQVIFTFLVNVFKVVFIFCVNVFVLDLLARSSSLFWSMYFRLSSYFGSMFVGLSSFHLKNVKGCEKSVKSVSVVKCHL